MGRVSLFSQTENPAQNYVAPVSREEFWIRDWEYVVKLVRTLLQKDARLEAEDVAADIFEKLLVRDVPSMYKGDVVSVHTKRRVTWRAFLSHQVALYVRGKQEQVDRRAWREPLWCDAPVGDGGDKWAEVFGGQVTDQYPSLPDGEFVVRTRQYLATLPEWEGPSLLDLFEQVLASFQDTGKVSLQFLRKKLGLTQEQAAEYLASLQREISSGLGIPAFEVGGVWLTVDEISEAARLLREAGGNHVLPVLRRAGHRLGGSGKTWYLGVAAQELRDYPELRIDRGAHARGGHGNQVKVCLVHWLERAAGAAHEALAHPWTFAGDMEQAA
jgi:hypothetical protein